MQMVIALKFLTLVVKNVENISVMFIGLQNCCIIDFG